MLRVNGLFGWVSYNDRRSATLFLSFVAAFHVLAAVVLFIPLAIWDQAHAPVYSWAGYLMRYVPLMTLAGAAIFLVQLWWHENLVRKQSGFRYTFKGEEPRLCRIAEPLVIAAGLPEPRLAIIESRALNAFACGLGQKSAVLVVTRGLLDELDDDELASVLAHEIAHIKNDDVRLMAAATVCQRSMAVLYNQGSWGGRRFQEAMSLGISLLILPVLFLVFVAVSFLRHSAIHFGYITRALISAAREFVADSESVQLTQNPAALVSALEKIKGRSHVSGLAAENDAMMIDGPSEGTFATHPSIAERVAAIVRLTGSMVLNAPARRDTRPNRQHVNPPWGRPSEPRAFGLRQKFSQPPPVAARESTVEATPDRNFLGFTWEMNVAACIAIAAFVFINRADLNGPRAIAAHFDLTEFSLVMSAIAKSSNCQAAQAQKQQGGAPVNCEVETGRQLAEYQGKKSFIGQAIAMMATPGKGTYALPGGGFTTVMPDSLKLEMARKNVCFNSARYSVGDRGLHRIDEPDRGHNSDISITRYMGFIARSVSNVEAVGPQHRDTMLKSYVGTRKAMIEVTHRFYGEPGLDMAMSAYSAREHTAIVETIRERLSDPDFTAKMTPLERADYELLTSQPDQFITCVARGMRKTG